MNSIIVDVAKCNFLRTLSHNLFSKYGDEECYMAFVNRMNEKAREVGMKNTKWINPSGLGESCEYSLSSARDLAILTSIAVGDKLVNKYWGQKERAVKIKKPYLLNNKRKLKYLKSTLDFNKIASNYTIIGGKTGSGDGYNTLALAWEMEGCVIAGAIMGACSEEDRFDAISELMVVSEKSYLGTLKDSERVFSASNACSYMVNNGRIVGCLYEQDSDLISPPMSTTKLMTVMVASEYYDVVEKEKEYEIVPYDIYNTGSGDVIHKWEALSMDDLIGSALISSSNVSSNAIARIVGQEIIKRTK